MPIQKRNVVLCASVVVVIAAAFGVLMDGTAIASARLLATSIPVPHIPVVTAAKPATVFCYAVEQGDAVSVNALASACCDIDQLCDGVSPIVVAIQRGHLDMVQLLAARGVRMTGLATLRDLEPEAQEQALAAVAKGRHEQLERAVRGDEDPCAKAGQIRVADSA